MSRGEAAGELGALMRAHTSATMRYLFSLAKRMGFEVSELAALEHLQAAGPMTMGELCSGLSMSPGAVTALVDRLERRGYVKRLPNPSDRRSSLVGATERGVEETFRHLLPYVRELRALEERLSGDEREAVARFLSGAAEIAHRHSAPEA
jgi:DNA-binding MarR family transcriptional regulator